MSRLDEIRDRVQTAERFAAKWELGEGSDDFLFLLKRGDELEATTALLYDALKTAAWYVYEKPEQGDTNQNRDARQIREVLAGVPDKVKELLRDAELGRMVRRGMDGILRSDTGHRR